VTLAHQQITRDWWEAHRQRLDLHISKLVLYEAGRGDQIAAGERLGFVRGLPVLRIDAAARTLAAEIFKATTLPDKAAPDALHMAISAVNGMDFLVTWRPLVCTPEELMTI
jgi:hypothetical protein